MMIGTKCQASTVPARHPMRRTTSMTEFAPPDVLADVAEAVEETELQAPKEAEEEKSRCFQTSPKRAHWLAAYRACAAPARVGHRRNSADFSAVETTAFLRACGLCNRRIGPGRDTFMYRWDAAFCSLECREQHIAREEWKVAPTSASSDKPSAQGTLAAA